MWAGLSTSWGWWLVDQTTLVDLTTPSWLRVYDLVFGIAVVVGLGLALMQLVSGMVRHEPRALATAAVGLARDVLGAFVTVSVTGTLLEIVDRLSVATGRTVAGAVDRQSTAAQDNPGPPPAAPPPATTTPREPGAAAPVSPQHSPHPPDGPTPPGARG